MELIVLLAINSFPAALVLGSLVLTCANFSLPARIAIGAVVVIVADIILSILTAKVLRSIGLIPVQHSVTAIQHYFIGEYLSRTVVYWIVGLIWAARAYLDRNTRFAIGIATAICICEIVFFFLEIPGYFHFGSRVYWIVVHLSFYLCLTFVYHKNSRKFSIEEYP